MEWPNELLRSHCDVLILSSGSFGAKDTALSVVEEIYYPNSINTGLLYFILKNLDNPQIIHIWIGCLYTQYMQRCFFTVLYCNCSDTNGGNRSS